MKNLIIIIVLNAWSVGLMAQDIGQSQVPSLVVDMFRKTFPNSSDVEWELKGEVYEADFDIGLRDHEVWIDKMGNITKHKQDILSRDLPDAVQRYINGNLAGYTIDDADKIEIGGEILFLVEFDGRPDKKILFTAKGEVKEETED